MAELPTGTVTFLFTDIEGSTRLLQHLGERYSQVLAEQRRLLRAAFQAHDGHELGTEGDSFFVAFCRAADAVAAVVTGQRALAAYSWPEGAEVRVRMGLHTGEPRLGGGDYVGIDVHRAARISAAGHGGQILLSQATCELVRDILPEGVSLRDLGAHRLKDLQRPEQVFQLLHPDLPADFPPLKSLDTLPNNLPLQPTRFLGREQETVAVREYLLREEVRLLTLTGPGGSGKTRLGLQVAADLSDAFPDGVFFVALAPITDPSLVAATIAQALAVRETAGRPLLETLREYLQDKQLLLLLDNFEQVVTAGGLVAELLACCPRLKVLVTSREALHLRGEQEFPVPPLALPDLRRLPPIEALSQYSAVELFIQRAIAVKPDFVVTNENAPAVAEICHRLDGLPLAIELAAARSKLLPPQALLERLESRLKLLVGGARDLPARQQTLRGAIAWSYELLEESEKTLFRRLSVFVGGCSLGAAEAVGNAEGDLGVDVLEGVAALVDKCLMQQEEVSGGEARLIMPELIREYARERLEESGEAEAIHRQHAHFFLALAEEADPALRGPDQAEWLRRLETEHENLRAALTWSAERQEGEAGLLLGAALSRFWTVRGYLTEGRELLAGLLAVSGHRTAARVKVINSAGLLACEQQDYEAARALHQEGLAISRELADERGIADSLNNLGWVACEQGDSEAARALCKESMAIWRGLGDERGIADSLHALGSAAQRQGDYQAAQSLFEESIAIWRKLGDKQSIAGLLNYLGGSAVRQEDYQAAQSLYEEGLAIWRELGYRRLIADTLNYLGGSVQGQGDYQAARALCEESMAIARELGDSWLIAYTSNLLGEIARYQGEDAAAQAYYEQSLASFREIDSNKNIPGLLCSLGFAVLHQGDLRRASGLFKESLSLVRKPENSGALIGLRLVGLAGVCHMAGQSEHAALLLGAAAIQFEAGNVHLEPVDRAEYDRSLTITRAALDEEAFATAWEEGCAMPLDQAIRLCLGGALTSTLLTPDLTF
jgi:predicted ATPase/class 3 adenylate cyclase